MNGTLPPPEKKLAVVTITRPGLVVAAKIAKECGADLFVSDRYVPNIPEDLRQAAHPFDGVLKNLLPDLFARYDGLVFIMALGIVVRSIGPLIADKTRDPAVLVGDVQGKFIISVLSGHLGGANRLAQDVARTTGAIPVVTTGTDVTQNVAPDLISQEIGAELDPIDQLKRVSSAIVDGDPVLFLNQEGIPIPSLSGPLKPNIQKSDIFPDPFPSVRAAVVISRLISDRSLPAGVEGMSLIPRVYGVGIGCNRGTSADEIVAALNDLLQIHRIHPKSLQVFGSIDLKADEGGILDTASRFSRPLFFFSRDALGAVDVPNPSGVVQKFVGTPAVAEPAAILALIQSPPPWKGHAVLEVEKKKSGNVTLALARWVPDSATSNP